MDDSKFQIRRSDCVISQEEVERILREAEFGTLAMVDSNGSEPYGVPVSFVFFDNKIWIHSASEGRKYRILENGGNVHFSAVQNVKAVFTKYFTTLYESAMAFGKIELVADDTEKRVALRALCQKYLPEKMDVADEHISRSISKTAIFKITPHKITGKARHA